MCRCLFVLFCLAVLAFCPGVSLAGDLAPAQAEVQRTFGAESATLENGLEIVVIPNHRAPVVTHMVWYKAGAADESFGKSGVAHFLEHLMFKGSEGLEPGEFSRVVKTLGGNDNAFTGQDYTAYFQTVAHKHLETVMKMEAGRMRGLKLTPETIASERQVIIEERRQRTDNDPQDRFYEQIRAVLHINHPYGTPIIGWKHEMETLKLKDAKRFYDRWYAPNNAILVVSGDVTLEEVRALAEKIYGPLKPRESPFRRRPLVPDLPSGVTLSFSHPDIHQRSVSKVLRVPGYRQNPEQSLAFQVLEDILSGSATSRLYKTLAVEQALVSSVDLSYSGDALDQGEFWIVLLPRDGVSFESAEAALMEQLRILVKDGVTDEELKGAITRLQDSAIFARDSLSGPAMTVGRALASGMSLEDVETWPQRIGQVTKERIQDVAKLYLDPDRVHFVTGYVTLPEEARAESVEQQEQQEETSP